MTNNMLRAPLLKSAVLLAAFSLIIYLTLSSPEGSVWSSLGAIFYAVFKAAQLGVGLVLALVLCFAVLGGIFFGCVAMISTESARKMYNDLQQFASDKAGPVKSLIRTGGQQEAKGMSREFAASLKNDIAVMNTSMENSIQAQRLLDERVAALQSRIEQIEEDESITKLSDWLRAEEEKRKDVQGALEQFDQQLHQMKAQMEDIGTKAQNVPSMDALQEIAGRTDALENRNRESSSSVSSLQEQVEALTTKLESVKPVNTESEQKRGTEGSEQEKTSEHRLFSYIEDPGDKAKVQQLVADTLQAEMTYAQAAEHLTENVGKKTAKVLAEHPSLTKEYIRECRKNKGL